MKNMKYIISHLKSSPCFKKFEKTSTTNYYLELIKKQLPKVLQKHLYYMYIKNEILIFIFDHPGLQTEFSYKKDSIKDIIKYIENFNKISLNIKDIQAKWSTKLYNRKKKRENVKKVVYVYREQAFGKFKNNLKDVDLFNKIENLKKNIDKNRKL
jgi:hypothetical protein